MYEYQYGKSRTAVILAKIVSEHAEPKKMQRKVGRLLMELNDTLRSVDEMVDVVCARFLYKLIFKHFNEKATELFGEGELATFTINVMNIRRKEGLAKLRMHTDISELKKAHNG